MAEYDLLLNRVGLKPGPAGGRLGPAASLNYGPAQDFLAGLQIGLQYGPGTTHQLNAILIKNNVSNVVSAQQNMTKVIIERICIIDNDKSSELITFNLIIPSPSLLAPLVWNG